jgi:N-dimethylarginine dimethylaminohydrolase
MLRNGETRKIRAQLEKVAEDLKLELVYSNNADAFIDGGDVLFTGKEFFVGQSSRTNLSGKLFRL